MLDIMGRLFNTAPLNERSIRMNELTAIIENGWVVCPVCYKKQFKLYGGEKIKNLKYRCKLSNGHSEHFMIVNVEDENK